MLRQNALDMLPSSPPHRQIPRAARVREISSEDEVPMTAPIEIVTSPDTHRRKLGSQAQPTSEAHDNSETLLQAFMHKTANLVCQPKQAPQAINEVPQKLKRTKKASAKATMDLPLSAQPKPKPQTKHARQILLSTNVPIPEEHVNDLAQCVFCEDTWAASKSTNARWTHLLACARERDMTAPDLVKNLKEAMDDPSTTLLYDTIANVQGESAILLRQAASTSLHIVKRRKAKATSQPPPTVLEPHALEPEEVWTRARDLLRSDGEKREEGSTSDVELLPSTQPFTMSRMGRLGQGRSQSAQSIFDTTGQIRHPTSLLAYLDAAHEKEGASSAVAPGSLNGQILEEESETAQEVIEQSNTNLKGINQENGNTRTKSPGALSASQHASDADIQSSMIQSPKQKQSSPRKKSKAPKQYIFNRLKEPTYQDLQVAQLNECLSKFGRKACQSRAEAMVVLQMCYKAAIAQAAAKREAKRMSTTSDSDMEGRISASQSSLSRSDASDMDTAAADLVMMEQKIDQSPTKIKKLPVGTQEKIPNLDTPAFEQAMLQCVRANQPLYLKILQYEPVLVAEFENIAKQEGLKCIGQTTVLRRWIDSQGITTYSDVPADKRGARRVRTGSRRK